MLQYDPMVMANFVCCCSTADRVNNSVGLSVHLTPVMKNIDNAAYSFHLKREILKCYVYLNIAISLEIIHNIRM